MNVLFETGQAGAVATTHDWLTPPEILQALGHFDLDPCASLYQPWRTATKQYTIEDDGLKKEWRGRVWCNPPYGAHAQHWLRRCASHKDAIAFVFARTDTVVFQDFVFPHAYAMLFLRGRVSFRLPNGDKAGPAGAPSVLVAFNETNGAALIRSGIPGSYVCWSTKTPMDKKA